MALTNYTELQAAIADWLNRTDLSNRITDFITLAEADLATEEAIAFERRSTITLNAFNVATPSDFREFGANGSLYFDDGIRQGDLAIVPPEAFAAEEGRTGNLTGVPRMITISANGTEFLCSPVPDQAYVAGIHYVVNLDVLSATNASNWVLADHPDLYLYGSLLHAAPFLFDDPRIQAWNTFYAEALKRLRSFIKRRNFSGNTMRMRPRRAIG